jgi:hypothetical protein
MWKSRSHARSIWVRMPWAAGLFLMASCGEQQEPRAAPIVARRLGGDSLAPGAMIKVCKPEDEACIPTYAVACSVTWAGDPAHKSEMPRLSPEEEAWCAAHGGTHSSSR